MKSLKNILLIGLSIFLLIRCSTKENGFFIRFSFDGYRADTICYLLSQNGNSNMILTWKKIAIKKVKDTIVFFDCNETNFFAIEASVDTIFQNLNFFVRPGETYNVSFIAGTKDKPIVTGDNNIAISHWREKEFSFCVFVDDCYNKELPLLDIKNLYENDISTENAKLDSLLNNSLIDQNDFEILKIYSEYGLTYRFAKTIIFNIDTTWSWKSIQLSDKMNENLEVIESVLNKYPYDNKAALIYPNLLNYISCHLWLQSMKDSIPCNLLERDCALDLAKKYLNNQYLELYFPNTLSIISIHDTKEQIDSCQKEFMKLFPKSKSKDDLIALCNHAKKSIERHHKIECINGRKQ
jgi:hypothetical protein